MFRYRKVVWHLQNSIHKAIWLSRLLKPNAAVDASYVQDREIREAE